MTLQADNEKQTQAVKKLETDNRKPMQVIGPIQADIENQTGLSMTIEADNQKEI
jgi:hypothetical protein